MQTNAIVFELRIIGGTLILISLIIGIYCCKRIKETNRKGKIEVRNMLSEVPFDCEELERMN